MVEERTKAIDALIKFKREFSGGFRRVFSGNSLESLNEYAKDSVSGLLNPVKNEITSVTNDLLSDTGLRSVVDVVTVIVSDIIENITKDEGVQNLLDKANPVIDALSTDVSGVIDWVASIFKIWGDWISAVPPAPPAEQFVRDVFQAIGDYFFGFTFEDWVHFIGSMFDVHPTQNLPPNFVIPTPPDVLFPPFDPDDPNILLPGDGNLPGRGGLGGGGFGWH